MKARFAVDFDGTLVEDDKYPAMGDWIPGAADAVRALERLGNVVIYSCRAAPAEEYTERPRSQDDVDRDIAAIKAKLAEEGLDHLEVWVKPYKPPAAAYIDNKGVAFRGDWEQTLEDVHDLIAPITAVDYSDGEEFISWKSIRGEDLLGRGAPRLMSPEVNDVVPKRAKVDEYRDRVNEGLWVSPVEEYTFPMDYAPPFVPKRREGVEFLTTAEPRRHPSSQRFHDRVKGWLSLHDRKQKDYGSDADPFANVRESARALGLPGWVGCVVRMNDKMRRLNTAAKQWIETGEVNMANEALIDSFDDLGVYSGIGGVLYEEES